MRVTFQHPPTMTGNPFNDFDPSSTKHYPPSKESGIYIWGLKMLFGEECKFVPIYVGIGKLRTRLRQHYNVLSTKWYFFNYCSVRTIYDLKTLYKSIDKAQRYEFLGYSPFRYSDEMLFFNNADFFRWKIPHYIFPPFFTEEDISLDLRSNELVLSHTIRRHHRLRNLIRAISSNIAFYRDNFYYIYASCDDLSKSYSGIPEDDVVLDSLLGIPASYNPKLFERIEYSTKIGLRQVGIYTAATAQGPLFGMDLDFSNVQDVLVNLGGHTFGNPYSNPLVLNPIRQPIAYWGL